MLGLIKLVAHLRIVAHHRQQLAEALQRVVIATETLERQSEVVECFSTRGVNLHTMASIDKHTNLIAAQVNEQENISPSGASFENRSL